MTTIPRTANLALAFLLELVTLVAVGLWGAHIGSTRVVSAGGRGRRCRLGHPRGVCFSPRALAGLSPVLKQVGQFAMFVVAVVALGLSGHWSPAAVFAALVVVNRVLIAVWGQEAAQQELSRDRA